MAFQFRILLIFAISVSLVAAQSSLLPENITLPPELQGKIDDKQIETIQNKTKEHLRTKCEKNGGPGAFEKTENAGADFAKCIQGLVDMSVLQVEIENAKPNGNVDEVFKKYCLQKKNFMACANQMLDTSKLCFTATERDNIKIVKNVTEQLAEFVCFKDGDRIALFIAEGGQECIQDKTEEIQECSKGIFGADVNLQLDNITSDNIPQLKFDKEQCGQLSQFEDCALAVFNTCPNPTTANIMESLFKFIRNSTPCKNFNLKSKKGNASDSASGLTLTTSTLVIAAISTLYV